METPTTPVASAVGVWVLRVGAFLLPLLFLPNIVDEFVLPKLLVARLLVAAMFVILMAQWVRQGAVTWRRTPLDLPLLAFIGSALLSTAFAVNRNVAIFGTYDRWEGLLTIVTYALIFWLAVQLLAGQSAGRGLTWSLLISAYFIAGAAILQSAFGLLGGGYFRDGTNGPIRADVTLANPDFTGIFLAMLLPVALSKVISWRPATRMLAANFVVIISLGLLATFTRAAWIGAVLGMIVVLALRHGRFHTWPVVISAAVVLGVFLILAGIVASQPATAADSFGNALARRVVSITNLSSDTQAKRLVVWGDTLPLVAARPLVGYGPDTFGLVYPQFQSSNRLGVLWDKPHMEVLGVAASQGIIGVLAYLWILFAFVRAFWQGRYLRGAVGLFAGFAAYIAAIQADFSYIPTSLPFWLFAAAAVVTWTPNGMAVRVAKFPRRLAVPALAGGSVLLVALLIPAVIFPFLADAKYYETPAAPDLRTARNTIAQARQLAPYEAAYAIEAGNYALNLDANGTPAANADWTAARDAYDAAARLGSYSPEMFRDLAIVDETLGDHAGAVAAARRAVQLDRYDAESRKLLARLGG